MYDSAFVILLKQISGNNDYNNILYLCRFLRQGLRTVKISGIARTRPGTPGAGGCIGSILLRPLSDEERTHPTIFTLRRSFALSPEKGQNPVSISSFAGKRSKTTGTAKKPDFFVNCFKNTALTEKYNVILRILDYFLFISPKCRYSPFGGKRSKSHRQAKKILLSAV